MAKASGGVAGQIAGTIGGMTYQNWRGIQTIREKPTPHNPKTARQMEVRGINTELSRFWRDGLNQGQRTAWNQKAKTFSWKTILGKDIKSTGENLFIKQNFQLLDFGLPKQETPPPEVMPPELVDVNLDQYDEFGTISVPQLIEGMITAQTPFLDVWFAGGFLTATIVDGTEYEATIGTQAISQGRVHQDSDFKHVFYLADKPVIVTPADSIINFSGPAGTIKNFVLLIRRYNKYGNYSQAKIIQVIGDTPA
jgi:hypothetical protein